NMVGAEFLPQPAILPLVDAVITHGGNNTVTECFHYGKPMIALPLFWDQYDNAQRLDDAGYGARLLTYEFEPEHMELALGRVLHDAVLRQHMQVISRRLQANAGTVRAADLIERVVA